MINHNPDRLGLLPAHTSSLQLRQREPAALADLGVVPHSLRTDGRAEGLQRTYTEQGSFAFAGGATAEFASRLVEPGTHAALPVLVEVLVREDYSSNMLKFQCLLTQRKDFYAPLLCLTMTYFTVYQNQGNKRQHKFTPKKSIQRHPTPSIAPDVPNPLKNTPNLSNSISRTSRSDRDG